MIAVVEPQCKGFSHEKFNSGFLYGIRLAFPDEPIRVYADASHIDAIRRMLDHDGVTIANIDYVPIKFRTKPGIFRVMGYPLLLLFLFRDVVRAGASSALFLSFNPEILFAIKVIKRLRKYAGLKFTLVLHGGFESVATAGDGAWVVAGAASVPAIRGESLREKVRRTYLLALPGTIVRAVFRRVGSSFAPWQAISTLVLTERRMLLWHHSSDFRYICLAGHVRRNASLYLDVDYLNFRTITLPTIFVRPKPRPINRYPKFAIFGYGNPAALNELLVHVENIGGEGKYEIRVISMDNRGTAGFANVTCPSPGRPMDRRDMERHAADIDMFLILYDETKYRLSCSGTILEALSYMKPILHLKNDCIDGFNGDQEPIGFRCGSLREMAVRIRHIADHYYDCQDSLECFRTNMLEVRRRVSIEASAAILKDSLTW